MLDWQSSRTDPLIEKQKRRWNEQRSNEKKGGPGRFKMEERERLDE